MAEDAAHKIIKNFTKKNRVGAKTEPSKFIVIHSTGNTASARNENLNTVNNDHKGVGAHYSVDGVSIYQSLADGDIIYHCGTGGYYKQKHPVCRNRNSIGVEMCQEDMHGRISEKTIQNTAWLVKKLMKDHAIPRENVIRHYDVVSKECPVAYAGTREKDEKWKQLKKKLVG